ncbi:MAG: DUF4153 domain-containing protein [Pseudomonadota bacterium]
MIQDSPLASRILILIALLQGCALILLHDLLKSHHWPHSSPQWLFAFYSVILAVPTMLLLGLPYKNPGRFLLLTAAVAVAVFLLGFYVGLQLVPMAYISYGILQWSFFLTMAIGVFKALIYSQGLVSSEPLNYSALFLWSWRNFLTLALALLFALAVWLILLLGGWLFQSIGIEFFLVLFLRTWFIYLTIALAYGVGVIIFRNLTGVIDSITRLQQALMKFLLVLLVLVSTLFLVALLFSGLHPLWDSGGSELVLWMQALTLFFASAVYQDDPEIRPYGTVLHRLIYLGIAALPVYSVISFYGLSLRVEQYGWTLSRCWAFLIWALLAVYSLGYLHGIIKRRDEWVYSLGRVNSVGGLLILLCVVLVNSPLLDFRILVLKSQLARLDNGEITLDDLDVFYIARSLAGPGYLSLQSLKEQYGDSNPGFAQKVEFLYQQLPTRRSDPVEAKPTDPAEDMDEFLSALTVVSGEPPEELLKKIFKVETRALNLPDIHNNRYYVLDIEVNNRPPAEFIVFRDSELDASVKLYYWDGRVWRKQTLRFFDGGNSVLLEAVRKGDIEAVTPHAQDIRIGDSYFRVR